jgi:Leucine-rich repeat (LRR) protein
LVRCENLKELPQSIASLSSLSMFDLTTCKYIESLRTPIGQLQHLTKQQLTNCGNFKQFPQSIAKLSSLSMLDLFGCKSIESLPITIGQLQHLTKLLF